MSHVHSSPTATPRREGACRMKSEHVNMNDTERMISVVSGVALALWGFGRLPKTSLLLLAGGLCAIYRGSTGHCHMYDQMGIDHGPDMLG